jgi:hypothetical protein
MGMMVNDSSGAAAVEGAGGGQRAVRAGAVRAAELGHQLVLRVRSVRSQRLR